MRMPTKRARRTGEMKPMSNQKSLQTNNTLRRETTAPRTSYWQVVHQQ